MPSKPGPKPFNPTDDERKLVEQMSAVGIPQESISLVVRDGIDDKTLRKHFRHELDTAAVKANGMVGGTLFNKAINGDTAACIFWCKTRMGWKETDTHEHHHTRALTFAGRAGGCPSRWLLSMRMRWMSRFKM